MNLRSILAVLYLSLVVTVGAFVPAPVLPFVGGIGTSKFVTSTTKTTVRPQWSKSTVQAHPEEQPAIGSCIQVTQQEQHQESNDNKSINWARRAAGIMTMMAALLSFHPFQTFATTSPTFDDTNVAATVSSSFSSTQTLAVTIRTLDMELPSYDAIKASKSSVENVEGLALEPLKAPSTSLSRPKTSSKEASPKKESDQGPSVVSSFLPSMGKQSAAAKAAAKQTPKQSDSPVSSPMPKYDF